MFKNQGKTIRTVFIPRYKVGCSEIIDPGVYAKENAIFGIIAENKELIWLPSNTLLEPTP